MMQSRDRGIEVAVLLLQASKLRAEFAFFLFGHGRRNNEDRMILSSPLIESIPRLAQLIEKFSLLRTARLVPLRSPAAGAE